MLKLRAPPPVSGALGEPWERGVSIRRRAKATSAASAKESFEGEAERPGPSERIRENQFELVGENASGFELFVVVLQFFTTMVQELPTW